MNRFLDAYKSNGLPMWGLTINNEPSGNFLLNDFYNPWNTMGFTPELERDFIKKDLGPLLETHGYGVNHLDLMIFDDQRSQIYRWANIILHDKEAAKYVKGTAVHWYEDNDKNVNELDKTHALDPSKYIINAEASNCCRGIGNWINAQEYAKSIIIVSH